MKVLWLAPIPFIDDSSSHPAPWIITLAKTLVNSGVCLTILNYNSKIEEEIIIKEFNGIELIYVKTPKLKLDLLTLYKIRINKVKNYLDTIIDEYDLIHIHGSEHQYEVMASKYTIPKVISIQGIINEYIKILPILSNYKIYIEWKISAMYEKKYLSQYKYFSCRTHWDREYVGTASPDAKIYTIWEMIRSDFFNNHFSENSNKVLFVGGKNPIKGLKELLFAFNDSLQEKGLELIILGNCDRDAVHRIIEQNTLENINIDYIECRGMQDASGMIKAYEDSFCLVHPTYIDNSPNSVCEAQLSGLPVIATDVGGVSSLIEDKKTGLLIGKESKDIEIAVDRLLNDDTLRKNISIESRRIARERHDPDLILEQTLKMYHNISESQ